MNGNANSFCEDVGRNLKRKCNRKGLYCKNLGNYAYSMETVVGLPVKDGTPTSEVVSTTNVYCTNQTSIDICPAGFYCPTPFTNLHCQPGYFCGVGSVEQIPCQWGRMACPYSGSNSGVYAGAFIFVLLVGLMIYNYFATRSIAFREYKFAEFSQ
eukprot:gene18040-25292_t